MKPISFSVFLLFSAIIVANAQNTRCDTLVLKDGARIMGIIEKNTETEFWYTTCVNPNAGLRVIEKSKVREIRSKNGVTSVAGFALKRFGQAFENADSSQLWQIVTLDGNLYVGNILAKSEEKINLRTKALGDIEIPLPQIREVQLAKKTQIVEGEFWYESPHNTRYFWSPSGYGLRKGEGYYQTTWVVFNQVSYGFTDYFTLGAGILPTFFFGGSGFPFWITPKLSVPLVKDKLNLGAGVLYFNGIGDFSGSGGLGLGYGVLTAGSRDRNFTLGMGYGFAEGEWTRSPVINASGMYRVSKRFFLLTENYVIPVRSEETTYGIVSAGGRFGGRGIAVDFGLFAPLGGGSGFEFALPWLGINVPFGRKRS
ncbi:MAG: hypothetical protein IT261_07455 [Saprospiraceae bacterium]|nr:hypothetical protein [Saprospiraceae bacterium]